MKIFILDGHPDQCRLLTHLLDHYQTSINGHNAVLRINVRDLEFSSNLKRGYAAAQTWEPDIQRVAKAIADCDHLVVGFPLWWGAEPALLKGLLDRVILPGFGFKYHRTDVWWDRLLAGRSADVIITMDTPPWYLRLGYGDAVVRRWRSQILGFCGFKPIRFYRIGPTRRGAAKKKIHQWESELTDAAKSVERLRRATKTSPSLDSVGFSRASEDRLS